MTAVTMRDDVAIGVTDQPPGSADPFVAQHNHEGDAVALLPRRAWHDARRTTPTVTAGRGFRPPPACGTAPRVPRT